MAIGLTLCSLSLHNTLAVSDSLGEVKRPLIHIRILLQCPDIYELRKAKLRKRKAKSGRTCHEYMASAVPFLFDNFDYFVGANLADFVSH